MENVNVDLIYFLNLMVQQSLVSAASIIMRCFYLLSNQQSLFVICLIHDRVFVISRKSK